LRQTRVKPEMPSSRAATCDTSIILPPMKGPRSVIRTTVQRLLSWLSTTDQRSEWQRPMRGGKIFWAHVFSARRLFADA
jgi:hypothetical protein